MPRRKAPKNTFWRGNTLWGRKKVKGVDHKWPLRTSDGEAAARRVKQDIDRLTAAAYYGDARRTYEDTATAWTEHIASHVGPQTAKRYAVSLKQLEPFLRPLFLDEITSALVGEIVKDRRGRGATNATIRRDLTALSSVIEFAADEGWREEGDNPALTRLRRVKERRDPIVLPESADIRKVIQRAPGNFARMIEAAWLTGCRLEELAGAKRPQLDHTRKQLTVIGKGNKLRTLDLEGWGYDLFRTIPVSLKGPWLFWHGGGESYRNASSRFRVMVADVEARKGEQSFRPFRFHDLRHRHAVDWLKSGRSIYDLQQRLGHTSVKTTEIYLRYLTADEQRIAKQAGPRNA